MTDDLQNRPWYVGFTDDERFPVRSHRQYEVDDSEDESCLHTATKWCLHVRVPTPFDVMPTIARVMASGAEALTGEYIGGDSFAEWAEPFGARPWYLPEGAAVHLYYISHGLERAVRAGHALAQIAGVDSAYDATISTAYDWAIQAECFPTPDDWSMPVGPAGAIPGAYKIMGSQQ